MRPHFLSRRASASIGMLLVSVALVACVPTMSGPPPRLLGTPQEVVFEAAELLRSPTAASMVRGSIEVRETDTMLVAEVFREGLFGGTIKQFDMRLTTSTNGDSTLVAVSVPDQGQELRLWLLSMLTMIFGTVS